MKSFYKKAAAFFLAIAVFAPGAYLGMAPVQEVDAFDFPLPEIGDALALGINMAVCYASGWASGLLAMVNPLLAPITQKELVTMVAPEVNMVADMQPGVVATLQGESSVAGSTVVVPVADTFVAAQNSAISLQLEAIAVNTQIDSQAAVTSAEAETSSLWKDCVLDPLAWMAKEMLIRAITDSILAWIKGGFEGSPAFISNPSEFFRGLSDEIISAYLFESGLDEFLCEPFRVDLVFNMVWDYEKPTYGEFGRLSCSLDEIFPGGAINIDIGGVVEAVPTPDANTAYDQMTVDGNIDFYGGGLAAVSGLLEQSNNVYGAHIGLAEEADKARSTHTQEESTELSYGAGWFTAECDLDGDGNNDTNCTPGEFISGHVDNWTDSALSELELADEFSEVLNALFQALVMDIFESVDVNQGLLFSR